MSLGAIRVLVVDDHPMVRDGVRAALSGRDGIDVVGEAGSQREAVDAALRLQPDVVLIDLHMPGGSGVVAIRELARSRPEARCLVLTMDDDDDSLFAAMRAGARGYLLKGARGDEIERGVRAAEAGDVVFGPGVAERVAALFDGPRRPAGADAFPGLSDRDLEVLNLLVPRHPGCAQPRPRLRIPHRRTAVPLRPRCRTGCRARRFRRCG